jgi:hypothetical protein
LPAFIAHGSPSGQAGARALSVIDGCRVQAITTLYRHVPYSPHGFGIRPPKAGWYWLNTERGVPLVEHLPA